MIDVPALGAQQRRDTFIAVAPVLRGKPRDVFGQLRFVAFAFGFSARIRTIDIQRFARATLRYSQLLLCKNDSLPAPLGAG